MTFTSKISAAALIGLLAATGAQAQDAASETKEMPKAEGQHMQDGGMNGTEAMPGMEGMTGMEGMAGMEGMMPMMKMMAQMGPMMEACTEMMQAMNEHMTSADHDADKG